MLRKLMLPLATALALTGCLTANGPADYSADLDPESESEFVPSTHTGRGLDASQQSGLESPDDEAGY